MMKILLLGLGRWGGNHLRNLHSLPIDLYVADVQPKALEAARKLGIPDAHTSTRPQDFYDRIDAAVIVTPAQTHFNLANELLNLGKDVFLEKPITLVSAEAQTLVQLAEQRGRILQVGHIFRYDPASTWLQTNIHQGKFGEIRMLRGNFSGFKRPRNDSGVAFADAIHFVDLFNYLLGDTPKRVGAFMQDFLGRGLEDCSVISLEYDGPRGKTWALIETNYFLPGKFRNIIVVGSTLSACCDYNVAQYKITTYQNQHVVKGTDFQAVEGTVQQVECTPEEPLLMELRAFIRSVQTREAPLADGWAGYHSVRALEAAFTAAKTGGAVQLNS